MPAAKEIRGVFQPDGRQTQEDQARHVGRL